MFTQQQLNSIDRKYFIVFEASPYFVTVKSRNTRHFWRIHYGNKSCTIFHSHQGDGNYHEHGKGSCLAACLTKIQKHDTYQLKHRKLEDNDFDYLPSLPDSEYFVC